MKSARVALAPTLAAQDLRGVLGFNQSDITFDQIDGALAGGRITGGVTFRGSADGLTATGRVGLAAANVSDLVPVAGAPLAGQLTLNLDLEGTGRSPVALIGSLQGGGTFTLQDGRIARLDPAAFDAIIRNVDQGLPIDAGRIRDRMELALGNGGLNVPLAEGEIAVAAGQARLSNAIVRAERADLTVDAGLDLAAGKLDAKLTLMGPEGAGGATHGRPEIGIMLKGPIGGPTRTLDVAVLSSWLALRAVEQQAKRLDALEAARSNAVDPPAAPVVTPPTAPAAPEPPAAPQTSAPPAVVPAVRRRERHASLRILSRAHNRIRRLRNRRRRNGGGAHSTSVRNWRRPRSSRQRRAAVRSCRTQSARNIADGSRPAANSRVGLRSFFGSLIWLR